MGKSGLGVHQVTLPNVLAEKVQGSHEVGVRTVEVSNLAPKISDQFKGGKLHEEMLNSPLLVLFGYFVAPIGYLCIDIAAQFAEEVDHMHELFLELVELLESFFFCLLF